ncbi:MAG TPA: hypothetical protein VF662_05580 [Allosphingosinicella sp.]|jgi:hypothetical protein
MAGATGWLTILSGIAGPATIAFVWARQARRESGNLTRVMLQSQQRRPPLTEHGRPRWYHSLAVVALLGFPFVQWFAYLRSPTALAFLAPLAAAMTIMLIVGMFFPLRVVTKPIEHREWALYGAVFALSLAAASMLPTAGIIIVLKGGLIDLLGITAAAYITRIWHRSRHGSLAPAE